MEVTVEQVKSIAKTLPIGYYCGREVEVKLDDGTESFYESDKDTITIGCGGIAQALNNIPTATETELEPLVRHFVYHELSHALLTPSDLYGRCRNDKERKDCNIVEDERIETLLSDYYWNTDFKETVFTLNGMRPTDLPDWDEMDEDQKFYSAVRYRYAPSKCLEAVNEFIKKHAELGCNDSTPYSYVDDVRALRKLIAETEEEPENKPQTVGDSKAEQEKVTHDKEFQRRIMQGEDEGGEQEGEGQGKGNGQGEGQGEGEGEGEGKGDETAKGRSLGKVLVHRACPKPEHDAKLQEDLEAIFRNFSSRSKANASATCSYSGVFNPRLAGRNDYRFWEAKSVQGSIKGFSNFHLNLFIDDSGSFSNDAPVVNEILYALDLFAKTTPQFDYTLIRCGGGQEICEPNDHKIYANDGTDLEDTICQQFAKVQSPTAVNYNILLYDGCAGGSAKAWTTFNRTDTAIIYECGNAESIEKYCQNAKKYFVRGDYASRLKENVLDILKLALT